MEIELEWEGNRQPEGTVCFPVACSCIAIMEGRSIRESISCKPQKSQDSKHTPILDTS
ncbi:hypothetical protein JMJ77_0006898, partial [Colletotrichum scovillei]